MHEDLEQTDPRSAPPCAGRPRTQVKLLHTNRSKFSTRNKYATGEDFRNLFSENLTGLYLLSYLLTGNSVKAEQCFVGGLEDCRNSNSVFKEWAHSWTRRVIVRNAIRMMATDSNHAPWTITRPGPGDAPPGTHGKEAAIATVLALGDIERFVFVLSILERYSDRDCSVLLSCSREEVCAARMRALRQVSVNFIRPELPCAGV